MDIRVVYRVRRNGRTVGAVCALGKLERYYMPIEVLEKLRLENAIITKDGVLRAKAGSFESRDIFEIHLDSAQNGKMYTGNTPKFGVTIKGENYIAKLPGNDYSCFSEDAASRFISGIGKACGFRSHKTALVLDPRYGVVVLLKDFTSNGVELHSYKDTNSSSEDTDISTKCYTYNDILHMIEKHTKLENVKDAKMKFWYMYMMDAILGNRDRHHGNWGYLSTPKGYVFAPIFDNGGSLFPDVSRAIGGYRKDRKQFVLERAERFPASLLQEYSEEQGRNKRTNYYEYLSNTTRDKFMQEAYIRIASLGERIVIQSIVDATNNPLIPWEVRNFYIDIVFVRYMHIIKRIDLEECWRRLLVWRKHLQLLW